MWFAEIFKKFDLSDDSIYWAMAKLDSSFSCPYKGKIEFGRDWDYIIRDSFKIFVIISLLFIKLQTKCTLPCELVRVHIAVFWRIFIFSQIFDFNVFLCFFSNFN